MARLHFEGNRRPSILSDSLNQALRACAVFSGLASVAASSLVARLRGTTPRKTAGLAQPAWIAGLALSATPGTAVDRESLETHRRSDNPAPQPTYLLLPCGFMAIPAQPLHKN